MKYQIWSNVTMRPGQFFSGYQPGDKMLMSWEGALSDADIDAIMGVRDQRGHYRQALEFLFMQFNHDDRPNGQIAHSLSIGDVVVLEGKAYAVATMGFKNLDEFIPVAPEEK